MHVGHYMLMRRGSSHADGHGAQRLFGPVSPPGLDDAQGCNGRHVQEAVAPLLPGRQQLEPGRGARHHCRWRSVSGHRRCCLGLPRLAVAETQPCRRHVIAQRSAWQLC